MKLGRLTKLLGVHDLACALEELGSAARRYALPRLLAASTDRSALDLLVGDLAVVAVAFTIQLAIEIGRDPGQMRDLERELIATLKEGTSQG